LKLCRIRDRELDLLGSGGHRLSQLWDLAGLSVMDMGQTGDYDLVVPWEPSWRYETPALFASGSTYQ
jgi:hypothetical protein